MLLHCCDQASSGAQAREYIGSSRVAQPAAARQPARRRLFRGRKPGGPDGPPPAPAAALRVSPPTAVNEVSEIRVGRWEKKAQRQSSPDPPMGRPAE